MIRYLLWGLLLMSSSSFGLGVASILADICPLCPQRMETKTGVFILDRGEDALMGRAWLTLKAQQTIDVQYFIWSTDTIGVLAAQSLLVAADRGVRVRVIVDDFLLDANTDALLALDLHPNITLKVYNPKHNIGVSAIKRYYYLLTNFRSSNQRMHDKTAIFDGVVGITGGRNMADEYFDYDAQYSFRDRDILLVGREVKAVTANFERFWHSDYAQSLTDIMPERASQLSPLAIEQHYRYLHEYAANEEHFSPAVKQAIQQLPEKFAALIKALRWVDARFISDTPGKNSGHQGLGGGGRSSSQLLQLLQQAEREVVIQSPYVVLPPAALEVFKRLLERGVSIKISTNSLASTDNLYAFSGYYNQRQLLLDMGVQLFEYKPNPDVQRSLHHRYHLRADDAREKGRHLPVFAIHAKSMVVDRRHVYVGTFNLDPRSVHLNTEVGVLVTDPVLAEQLYQQIATDMDVANSWQLSTENNPDKQVSFGKRAKLYFLSYLPLQPIL